MRITWSLGEGSVDVWFDGEQVVDGAVAQTLSDGNPHFTQIGLLRDAIEFDDVPVIVLDDAVEGDSLEDVRPADLPVPGDDDGGGSDEGGEGTAGPGADDTSASAGGLDTSGGGGEAGSDGDGPGDGTSGAPGSDSGDDWALPPGFSGTGDDAAAGDDGQGGCQCRSSGSARMGGAWGLVLLALLGARRRPIRRG
jgi:MYXO-CTERM domain-containing protein